MSQILERPRVERVSEFKKIRHDGVLLCGCGTKVQYGWGDVECPKCQQLYNAFGQRLVPRSQWEEPWDDPT